MKTLPLLFSLLWAAGCSQDTPEPTPELDPTDVQPQVEPEPEPEPEPQVDALTEALQTLERGELDAALQAIEPLLTEHADDPALWYALELCALGSDKPGELLDRLSPTDAIGDQPTLHHSLRATLALAADRPADALDASIALKASDPANAAAFLAMAANAGADVPADTLDATLPADALVLLMTESNPRKRKELLETAAQAEGWRAALLRAGLIAEDEEQREAYLAELSKVAEADDPRAVLAAAQARLALLEDPAEAAAVALEASSKAREAHNVAAATQLLTTAVDLLLRQGKADEALEATTALLGSLPEGPSTARSQTTLAAVDAGLAAGAISDSIELAVAAIDTDKPSEADAQLAASLTRAAWRSCDLEKLETAAELLPEAQASLPRGMAAYCVGDIESAREKLGAATAHGALGVDAQLALALAWYDDDNAQAAAEAAVAEAERLGWLTQRLEAGLALERHARIMGNTDLAAQTLTALEEGAAPALQAEIWVRRLGIGIEAPAPPSFEGEPAEVVAWRGFAEAAAPGEAPSTGVAAWAEARHALVAGDANTAKAALARALPALPTRRQGRWAPPLALDGADGPALEPDIALAIPLQSAGGDDVVLALHEFSHFRDFQRMAASVGYDWAKGMEPDAISALALAHAKEQARSMLWLAGTATFPADERAATLATIPDQPCFASMTAAPSVAEARARYAETALFSVRLGTTTGELLLITPSAITIKQFDKPAQLRADIQTYLDALNAGQAFGGGPTDPRAGDRFRGVMIDSVVGELVGIARYLVVADPDLIRLPWAVLPEQAEGRRYLADIRTVSTLPYLGPEREPTAPPEAGYKPDFLGISREQLIKIEDMTPEELAVTDDVTRTMLEAGLKPQGETSSIARLFGGGYSLVKLGTEATAAAFDENMATARYVHLAGIPSGPAGSLVWTDGETELAKLSCSQTSTKLAVISYGPSPEIQLVRAQALREAGANGVLVAMWNPPPILRSRYLTSVYDALNRERTPARALAEARETLVNTLGADGGQADPSYWGAFLYIGAP